MLLERTLRSCMAMLWRLFDALGCSMTLPCALQLRHIDVNDLVEITLTTRLPNCTDWNRKAGNEEPMPLAANIIENRLHLAADLSINDGRRISHLVADLGIDGGLPGGQAALDDRRRLRGQFFLHLRLGSPQHEGPDDLRQAAFWRSEVNILTLSPYASGMPATTLAAPPRSALVRCSVDNRMTCTYSDRTCHTRKAQPQRSIPQVPVRSCVSDTIA